jgi:hypothetical protein
MTVKGALKNVLSTRQKFYMEHGIALFIGGLP